jgi:hypothetical protein
MNENNGVDDKSRHDTDDDELAGGGDGSERSWEQDCCDV